jgi:1,4-alpha-glucan branching enzyme
VILLAAIGGCTKNKAPRADGPKPRSNGVRFTMLAPGAKQVCLVGSFNGWVKGATPMTVADSTGLWVVEIPLKEGEHTFMFLVDDVRWVTPPSADDFVTDEFGHVNGIVIVR